MRQHADLDPVGLATTAWLADRAGTVPWRMGATDYLGLVRDARDETSVRPVPATSWDPELRRIVQERQVWTYEEQVRADLLAAMRSDNQNGVDPTA